MYFSLLFYIYIASYFQVSGIVTSTITLDFIIDTLPAFIPTIGALIHLCARIPKVNKASTITLIHYVSIYSRLIHLFCLIFIFVLITSVFQLRNNSRSILELFYTLLQSSFFFFFSFFQFRELFDHIWSDWALQKTEVEAKILHDYAETTRLVTLVFTRKRNLKSRLSRQRKLSAFTPVRSRLHLFV